MADVPRIQLRRFFKVCEEIQRVWIATIKVRANIFCRVLLAKTRLMIPEECISFQKQKGKSDKMLFFTLKVSLLMGSPLYLCFSSAAADSDIIWFKN